MQVCCICGEPVEPGVDCEERFTGRTKYICYGCLKNGADQVGRFKANYFYGTYEGQRRLESRRRKQREK